MYYKFKPFYMKDILTFLLDQVHRLKAVSQLVTSYHSGVLHHPLKITRGKDSFIKNRNTCHFLILY